MSESTQVEEARTRFEADTAEHQMTVLHDDGLYRHLRFQRPDSSFYWFDIVTWPGVLTVSGDCGCFVFSRIQDMFEFFERDGINPHYWSEKLRAPDHRAARVYSYDAFVERVRYWAADAEANYGDFGGEADVRVFQAAVEEQIISDPDGTAYHDENEAHRRLRDFEHSGRQISDSWEWDLREYDWQFLWCCWAIVWGIAQYRNPVLAGSPRDTELKGGGR